MSLSFSALHETLKSDPKILFKNIVVELLNIVSWSLIDINNLILLLLIINDVKIFIVKEFKNKIYLNLILFTARRSTAICGNGSTAICGRSFQCLPLWQTCINYFSKNRNNLYVSYLFVILTWNNIYYILSNKSNIFFFRRIIFECKFYCFNSLRIEYVWINNNKSKGYFLVIVIIASWILIKRGLEPEFNEASWIWTFLMRMRKK